MHYGIFTACLALLASPVMAQTLTPITALPAGVQTLDVHVGGRVVKHVLSGGATAYEHQWPGIYFESRFSGRQVFLSFDDPVNEYRLLIDDLAPVTINQPGDTTLEVS